MLGITTNDLPNTWKTDLATKLGGKNLSDLPSSQTLASLIDSYDTDKKDLQNRLNQAQAELNKNKTERDQLKQQLEKIEKELGFGKGTNEQQILNKIKELMKKPNGPVCTHTDYEAVKNERDSLKTDNENKKRKISELENKKENKNDDVITKKVLIDATNTNLTEWGIEVSSEQREKIQNAVSAQAVEEMRSEIIKTRLGKLKGENKVSLYLNVSLGSVAIGSLLLLG